MTTGSLLYDLGQLSRDYLEYAMETEGVKSGLFAEFSQRLRELQQELDQRLTANGFLPDASEPN